MIVYLHGFLGCRSDWDFFCQTLPGPHLPLILPEPLPKDPVAALLSKISKPVTLIGYSLGGRLALNFAHRFPHLIEKLIILSANPGITDPKERKKRRAWEQSWCDIIDQEGFEMFLEKWYAQDLFKQLRCHPTFHAVLEKRKKHHKEAVKEQFLRLSPAVLPPLWEAIPHFSFPTLFLFGEHDVKYHLIHHKLEKLKMQTKMIPNSGHAIHLENPRGCIDIIKRFL